MARWSFLILALLISIAACQQQEATEEGTTEGTAAVVDPAAVEDHIRTSADRFSQAMVAGDVETMVSVYADNAITMPPGMPRVEGVDALRSTFQEWLAMGKPTAFSLNPQTVTVSESGDMAYEVGTFSLSGPGPDGAEMTDTGKYLAIWQPTEGGEWKMAVDIWNSDQMPGMEPTESTSGTTEPEAPTGQ